MISFARESGCEKNEEWLVLREATFAPGTSLIMRRWVSTGMALSSVH
jgi:hypothetical protein